MEARKYFVFILILGIISVGCSGCSSLLYHPTRALYMDPSGLRPPPENLVLKGQNDLDVHGWYFHSKSEPPKGVLLFFHGNGQNRSAHFMTLYWITEHGYDLAIFDYPGYGQTKGSPSPQSTVETAMLAIKFIKARNSKLPLIVYGQSLGGAISMRAVWELRNEVKPNMLIIDSSFLSYQKVARQMLAKTVWTWLFQPLAWVTISDRWAPENRLKDMTGFPVVVIHSKEDEMISYTNGREVFDSANDPKELWLKESGLHNETFGGPEGKLIREKLLIALSKSQ